MIKILLISLAIFLFKVLDIGLETVRFSMIIRKNQFWAAVIGFVEVIIWLYVIKYTLDNLYHPLMYIAYAGGFVAGQFVGIKLSSFVQKKGK